MDIAYDNNRYFFSKNEKNTKNKTWQRKIRPPNKNKTLYIRIRRLIFLKIYNYKIL